MDLYNEEIKVTKCIHCPFAEEFEDEPGIDKPACTAPLWFASTEWMQEIRYFAVCELKRHQTTERFVFPDIPPTWCALRYMKSATVTLES